jgi:hypothetical protein
MMHQEVRDVCPAHDDLLKVAIETSTDVKHILNALTKAEKDREDQERRISTLEAKESERKGEARGITRTAAIVAGIISASGTLVSIGAFLLWGH